MSGLEQYFGTQPEATKLFGHHLVSGVPTSPPSSCPQDMQGLWMLLLLGLRLQLSLGVIPVEEENPAFWNRQAAEALDAAKKLQPIQRVAKNLILFLGDGE
ncbi:hypothetical protein P7K49_013458 [Saguinus oedipus]|uniref:Alkaline phosphatase n=1 Tax=Saguinus oedipus TaxID=9490 RepID=A0ABQ9VI33_SAGOE|nr:hypothetical protein P7K49_013458 [Saguinus oedipus]